MGPSVEGVSLSISVFGLFNSFIDGLFDAAVEYWRTLASDPDAFYDKEVVVNAADIKPTVTWGTSPQDVVGIDGVVVIIDTTSIHFVV